MSIQLQGYEQVTHLLHTWYHEIRAQHISTATKIKHEIEEMIDTIEKDQNLLLYYYLLDFRFKVLNDNLSITPNSFDKIETLYPETDKTLSYYFHLFKAIHSTILSNNTVAKEQYEKAENSINSSLDELEKAEFSYRFANFYLHTYQPLLAIQYVSKAKEIFSKHVGHENNVAGCDNIFGAACIDIKQFPQAEESFNSAINIYNKQHEETLLLRVRNNLGFLYASQNLSELAIRQLTDVTNKLPNHFKAIFLKAREHFKLEELHVAEELITRGLTICKNIDNQEYLYHFTILDLIVKGSPAEVLEECIINAIKFFNNEQLFNYTQEYTEKLALAFHAEDNHSKASEYFYLSHQTKEKTFEKGALK
ncbi:hypothetical protein [Bacillus thuringiensis]|uniref:response regulator aspartate phosphatase n=1 Tax=Bacillus thuringiensis TaxID=1428 RepID=UPI001EE12B13|nr:hypothetical protein [Bacillus thuringiensis]MCG3422678.1 hypothetical protein [Bacillus thuringiensis]